MTPRAHVELSTFIRSLNPWRALSCWTLDSSPLYGVYRSPLPKQDKICIARDEESELSEDLFASSASAYQKYNRDALGRASCLIKLKVTH